MSLQHRQYYDNCCCNLRNNARPQRARPDKHPIVRLIDLSTDLLERQIHLACVVLTLEKENIEHNPAELKSRGYSQI